MFFLLGFVFFLIKDEEGELLNEEGKCEEGYRSVKPFTEKLVGTLLDGLTVPGICAKDKWNDKYIYIKLETTER